jgi:uncharacterized MnhB-related membrane protein
MFWAIDFLCLGIILAGSLCVLWLRNLNACVIALSAIGTVMTLLFVVLGAPDAAHSEALVGAIALPTLYFVAIGKIRTSVADDPDLDEKDES